MRNIILYFVLFFSTQLIQAQQELGTYFMTDLWQSTHLNPAFIPDNKLTVALPSLYYNYSHSGGPLTDIIRTTNNQTLIDFGEFIGSLSSQNDLNATVAVPTLEIAYKLNDNFRLSLGHQVRFDAQLAYPKSLAELLWFGNAPFIGQGIEIGPSFDLLTYHEIGLGAAYKVNDWTLGAKVKYLVGIGTAFTGLDQANLFTSDDIYQLSLETNYEIWTASLIEINDLENFNFDFNQNIGNFNTKNSGFALDLGLRYQINEQIEFSASVLDIGKINWDKTTLYRSQGTETFDGIDLVDVILNDSIDFEVQLDTLQDAFEFTENNAASFSTTLTNKIYLGLNYEFNDRLNFGAVYLSEESPTQRTHAFALSAQANLIKNLTLGLTYSSRYKQFDNLGFNLKAKLGPVQIYGMTDNLPGLFVGNNFNGRVGLNLLF